MWEYRLAQLNHSRVFGSSWGRNSLGWCRDFVNSRVLFHKHAKIGVNEWVLETTCSLKHATIFGGYFVSFFSFFLPELNWKLTSSTMRMNWFLCKRVDFCVNELISLHIRSMWETTVMHKQVSGCTVNFGPNFPESPFLELKTRKPPPPPPFQKTSDLGWPKFSPEYSPPLFRKLQIWDDQSLLRNTPPFSENFRFGMTKVYSGIPPLSENFRFGMTKVYSGIPPPPPFRKTSDLGWPKFTPEYQCQCNHRRYVKVLGKYGRKGSFVIFTQYIISISLSPLNLTFHWRIQWALGTRVPPPPPVQFLSFSCSFRQKPCQIIGFLSKIRVWRPRLGNSGSVTAFGVPYWFKVGFCPIIIIIISTTQYAKDDFWSFF